MDSSYCKVSRITPSLGGKIHITPGVIQYIDFTVYEFLKLERRAVLQWAICKALVYIPERFEILHRVGFQVWYSSHVYQEGGFLFGAQVSARTSIVVSKINYGVFFHPKLNDFNLQ